MKGAVKWWNDLKGYGSVAGEGGDDVFVHRSELSDGTAGLEPGETIEFEIHRDPHGLQARNVRRVSSTVPKLDLRRLRQLHRKHCFVVMPFGRTPPEVRWFRGWYETVIRPGIADAGYEPILAATEERRGPRKPVTS